MDEHRHYHSFLCYFCDCKQLNLFSTCCETLTVYARLVSDREWPKPFVKVMPGFQSLWVYHCIPLLSARPWQSKGGAEHNAQYKLQWMTHFPFMFCFFTKLSMFLRACVYLGIEPTVLVFLVLCFARNTNFSVISAKMCYIINHVAQLNRLIHFKKRCAIIHDTCYRYISIICERFTYLFFIIICISNRQCISQVARSHNRKNIWWFPAVY